MKNKKESYIFFSFSALLFSSYLILIENITPLLPTGPHNATGLLSVSQYIWITLFDRAFGFITTLIFRQVINDVGGVPCLVLTEKMKELKFYPENFLFDVFVYLHFKKIDTTNFIESIHSFKLLGLSTMFSKALFGNYDELPSITSCYEDYKITHTITILNRIKWKLRKILKNKQ